MRTLAKDPYIYKPFYTGQSAFADFILALILMWIAKGLVIPSFITLGWVDENLNYGDSVSTLYTLFFLFVHNGFWFFVLTLLYGGLRF